MDVILLKHSLASWTEQCSTCGMWVNVCVGTETNWRLQTNSYNNTVHPKTYSTTVLMMIYQYLE